MIRRVEKNDREKLVNIINDIKIFNENDKKIAIELIDETIALENINAYDYNIFIYEHDKKILGYHCTGKRYLTEGVFDLYWIVVDNKQHGKGVGKELLKHAEQFVKDNQGYLILAETSSREEYDSTRKFYVKNNYEVIAKIKDFYKVGEDLIIFGKYLII